MKPLPSFAKGDGAHCGLGDWYPKQERALLRALKRGKPFITGWYSSKKEIASAMIARTDRSVEVHVSVSDDFDTEGKWSGSIKPTTDLERIRCLLYKIWDLAVLDQKGNRAYRGFTIWKDPKGTGISTCLDYLILPHGDAVIYNFKTPPGACYQEWGFQGPTKRIPKAIREELRVWAEDYTGTKEEVKEFHVGKYTITPWEGD